ncbi:hypothetical protein [Paenibacillus sp. UNC496MF]|uniref:hypothetical protein n=1 Tax=Paenibacillus sp. UNC496MF TaxID=1502753 RepID=UPI0015A63FA7|nr:hypothetical protein [Paenibacillus sp. UNC496MF]
MERLTAHRFAACEFVWRQHEPGEMPDLMKEQPPQISCMGGTIGFQTGAVRC